MLDTNLQTSVDTVLLVLSSGILGVFLGAQLTEAVLLVPFWKTMQPDAFFRLHQQHHQSLYRFYAPLTIAATLLPLATVVYLFLQQSGQPILLMAMGLSTLVFFSTYFIYFKRANRSFAERSLSDDALPGELRRWGRWHWGRVCFEAIAFGCALALLMLH